ncbi:glycosyltransferase family 39 protein [Segetibacter sp. 3557_3]|uniref:ArnT family glycosyltransferase n=1 Tax=Segetibacter sp. 3557_3 TaxID=2547429 RepID=UPI0010590F74|nr:glycosyltransferase family 39 protein [Segetibacter sp. 3557_3]TDH26179.1 glycosyltransferase family 39 protein [Segetibacter sp. 3557_3]
MQTNQTFHQKHFIWLMAILFFILFFKLGSAPIYILDEAKNAQCAREMLQRNDWVVPTFNGELRTDKPVLHYYFMMTAYKLFGVSEFAARFFSALLGCLTVLLTFMFSKKYTGALTGFCAALVLAASTQFLFEFRLSVPDPYLIFFIAAGLFTGYAYLQQGKLLYLLLAAVAFGLATLAKGPVALALPGLCLLVWVILRKNWAYVFSWKMLLALLVIAAITAPWYLAVHKATNGAWTQGFFIEHNLNRFSDPQEGHGGLFIVTILFVLIGMLPFTSFLGEVTKARKAVFDDDFIKFAGIVVLAFVVFFSISSTKLPNYPMPCYPFAAIIIGHYLSKVINGDLGLKKYPLFIVLVVLFAVPIGGYFAIQAENEASRVSTIALFLLVAPLAMIAALLRWNNTTNYLRIIRIAGAYSLLNILALHIVYPVLYLQNPVAKTLATVKKYKVVLSYKLYNPGFNFYLDQNVQKFFDVESLRNAIAANPDAVVISRMDNEADLQKLPLKKLASHHDLFESPTTVVYASYDKP